MRHERTRRAPRGFRALAMAAFGAMALGIAPAGAAKPMRIVSLNLCTDELLLRLAPPERIASITWLSRDPRNANMAEAARAVPVNHGLAEEVLADRPDLVIAGTYTTRATVSLLRRVGAPVREFGVPRSIAEMRAQIAEMAALLGEEARGATLIADIDARLAALAAKRPPERHRAIVLRPNGFTVGRGSLVDEILSLAGLDNIAASLGIDSYGQIALETVALGGAEMLILNDTPDGPPSLAHEVLRHPLIEKLGERLRLVALPSRLWTCAGPSVLDAIELLARATEGKR
ncbi:Iron complex transport system substrate-binding protein [Hyphomicrobiales bacterium]|nr:Iron complex transport system substrate-binding protein [Hyphomicrobiales bacterium]CAH1701536.1 Iron complex transport system substrate-binding protein [Hyphomicrobiales bacterium]CAI0345711.1 iron complex transport system substrate-binding protein [Hyphomicrobiales bacterium]